MDFCLAALSFDVGGIWAWRWHHRFGSHHALSRFGQPGRFWGATPDVCILSGISLVLCAGEIPLDPELQSPGPDHGRFSKRLLGAGEVTLMQVGASFGVMVVVLAIGMMLFTHVEKTFMDTV